MKFTESHEWVAVQGDVGTVGITQHAQSELGEVVYAELPAIGEVLNAGDEAVVLESTKAAADITTPVSGEVIAVNTALKNQIGALNTDAENTGWLFKIRLTQPEELQHLLNKEQYLNLIQ
jgi:glycine cleavage system H protein